MLNSIMRLRDNINNSVTNFENKFLGELMLVANVRKNDFQDATTFELERFLSLWDELYAEEVAEIELFSLEKKFWTLEKQRIFALTFYHLRGNFHDFLWYLGNHAPNKEFKKVIVSNIMEEFSMQNMSHEKLYFAFCEALSLNLNSEISKPKYYFDFAKDFNEGHLNWLRQTNWNQNFSAFSAYERLDNIDYANLLKIVNHFDINDNKKIFFKIHAQVEHFEETYPLLIKMWQENCNDVTSGFYFIFHHQINMWKHVNNLLIHGS